MKKKLLNQLISYSYKKNTISPKNVKTVAGYLIRSDLKQYLKGLKLHERRLSVFIDVPINHDNIKDKFRNVFPDKKIIYSTDPSLMLGLRILANDMLFELNLKNSLDRILLSIKEDYD